MACRVVILGMLALMALIAIVSFAEAGMTPENTHGPLQKDDALGESKQGYRCRYGCCGGWWNGQCRRCCYNKTEEDHLKATKVDTEEHLSDNKQGYYRGGRGYEGGGYKGGRGYEGGLGYGGGYGGGGGYRCGGGYGGGRGGGYGGGKAETAKQAATTQAGGGN